MPERPRDRNETIGSTTFVGFGEPVRLEPGLLLADGRYRLISEIGHGGMGVVWSAQDLTSDRKVVLKFVPREINHFESAVAQLKASFQKVHELHHQHICPIYGLEEDRSFGYYLVMRWLDGETLDQYVSRILKPQFQDHPNPMPLSDVLRILRPVAYSLDYAHNRRIIHRDIKPSNIFIELDALKSIRDVQVIDFGLASEIRGTLVRVSQIQFDNSGTRPYMASEQWRGDRRFQTGKTDQYALGVVAYELLSGHLPFDSADVEILRLMVLQDKPAPISGHLDHVNAALLKALEKAPEDRFGSCEEFVKALEAPVVEPVVEKNREAGARMELSVKGVAYAFRWCPAGTFKMGSRSYEPKRGGDELQHDVTLTRGFWMLETSVTQAMWESVTGSNPSHFKGVKLPVENVSWEDCQAYIEDLNALNVAPSGFKFCLPTESQWEYACRAGTPTPFHFGGALNGAQANCNGDNPYGTETKGKYLARTSEAGSYPSNAWGLYDMHGNVYDWCSDWYGDYPSGVVIDPEGPSTGSDRVIRGGSWLSNARYCRSAYRSSRVPSYRNARIGARLSLVRVE